jgi:hypothetical protein
MFLVVRRLAGGLAAPLPPLILICAGLIAATAAWAVHVLSQSGRPRDIETSVNFAPQLATLALPIFAIAISLPGSSSPGLIVLWLTTASAEVGLWRLRKKFDTRTAVKIGGLASRSTLTETDAIQLDSNSSLSVLDQEDVNATQRLIYRRSVEGAVSVDGWLRADFVYEQRTAVVHVAFCPAFNTTPNVETEIVDGSPCEIRPTLVLPWGVRWEIKLDSPAAQPASATFEFVAYEPH